MTFKPRLAAPAATDKHWIHTSKGGLNSCILISGNSCLPNCFVGETEFITSEGIKTLRECEGKQIKVLSEGGVFRSATVKNFGKQEIFKLVLQNGSEYLVTGNHRWVVDKYSQHTNKEGETKKYKKRTIKATIELNENDYLPYEVFKGNEEIDKDGIRHGFIFGDGSLYNEKKQSRASLCGYKKEYMKEYFADATHSCKCANGTIEYYPYPKEYKMLPSIKESEEYLRGFIVGYLASDGCVSQDGSVRLDSTKYEDLKTVRNICAVIGIRTTGISKQSRSGYGDAETELYHIYLFRTNITEEMLLNPAHRRNFAKIKVKNNTHTRIKSLVDTNEERDVYCVVEPETHTMVLANNILTGQCVGYAWGRFYEILGNAPKLSRANAEMWFITADGYKRGQTPKVGAVACWRKGKAGWASDGAGHVAIVEKVNADGSILISESGYKAFRFRTRTLKPPYSIGGTYVFQGFIYNPAVEEEKEQASTKPSAKVQFIKAVQAAIGAKVDGIAGQETLAKTVTVSSTKNSKHKVVKPLQIYLNYLGYDCGTADGIAGGKFTKAVKKYQFDKKCAQDGEITAKGATWKKLLGLK